MNIFGIIALVWMLAMAIYVNDKQTWFGFGVIALIVAFHWQ